MKKRSVLVFVLVILSGLLSTPLNAAPAKAGAKCTKAGATSTVAGKKFTCIKSGTRLVWNKGVTVKAAAKPEPTATPNTQANPASPVVPATPAIKVSSLSECRSWCFRFSVNTCIVAGSPFIVKF
jgi:hypothetical protein